MWNAVRSSEEADRASYSRRESVESNEVFECVGSRQIQRCSGEIDLETKKVVKFQINYHKDPQMGEYQIISARKSANPLVEEDPEELMKQLAMDMKRERLAVAMMNNKKDSG